jgi:hypothetical protein
MTKKPYEPPQMQPMTPEVWSELIRSVRAGAGRLQGSVADLLTQPLAVATEGREQELELLEATIEGNRVHGTFSESDLAVLADRCARIRRALHMKAV